MSKEPVALRRPNARVTLAHMRVDVARDTQITAQRNVNRHVYVQIGHGEITLIIHPHAAKRLIANIEAVFAGDDFAAG